MIDDCLPPPALLRALEGVTSGVRLGELREAAQRLSVTYRQGLDAKSPVPAWADIDRLAYVGARMPATYRAKLAALTELRSRCPHLHVESLLDVGGGPGTSLWAAAAVFDGLSRATLFEPDSGMVALARRLLKGSALEARVDTTWRTDAVGRVPVAERHDLVVAAYLLTELEADQRAAVIESAWLACGSAVVFIEPGSVDGFRNVIDARQRLLDLGARVVAPCPHERPCPLPPGDLVSLRRSTEPHPAAASIEGWGAGLRGREVRVRRRYPWVGGAVSRQGDPTATRQLGPRHAARLRAGWAARAHGHQEPPGRLPTCAESAVGGQLGSCTRGSIEEGPAPAPWSPRGASCGLDRALQGVWARFPRDPGRSAADRITMCR